MSNNSDFNNTISDFTAMTVHELRSPLSVIRGSADLLLKERKNLSEEDSDKLLSQIKDSAVLLLKRVGDILDVSKLESGKIDLALEKSNINDLLQDEDNYYINLAKDHGLDIKLDLDASIEEFPFDKSRIREVLDNLLSNSIKFTPAGGHILITSRKVDHHVLVTVSDTGTGISKEVRDRLFQKFVQSKISVQNEEKGTGLGLAIVKGIVEAHGGKVWVEDNNPTGSEFVFTLPIR